MGKTMGETMSGAEGGGAKGGGAEAAPLLGAGPAGAVTTHSNIDLLLLIPLYDLI